MKKILIVVLSVILTAGGVTGVVIATKHKHSYTAVVTQPTCTERGYTTYTCSCGNNYVDDYVEALDHNYVNGICSRCEELEPTDSSYFSFALLSNDTYVITGYNEGLPAEVILPSSYNGKPVTSIGYCAFAHCYNLTSVVIGDSVTSIGENAFAHCYNLTSVVIGDSVTSIGDYAFYYCSSLTSVVIPDSVTSIGNYAFYNCDSLTSVVIPDSVTSIGSSAFSGCSSLTSVIIPDSVTSIGNYAFAYCYSLDVVYYKGSESDWSEISIGSFFNSDLTSATRYYYSESQPEESGEYWHYGENGEIVIW